MMLPGDELPSPGFQSVQITALSFQVRGQILLLEHSQNTCHVFAKEKQGPLSLNTVIVST